MSTKTIILASLAAFCFSQTIKAQNTTIPVLRTESKEISVLHDGVKQTKWYVSPEVKCDSLFTTGGEIMLCSDNDSLTIRTGKPWDTTDIAIVTNSGDTAHTRIIRKPTNIYTNPPKHLLTVNNGILTKEQAKFDINSLIYALLEIHPDIFSVAGHKKIMSAFNETLGNLPDSLTTIELYNRVAPVVTLIGDGHTMTRFPYNDIFTDSLKRLPIYIGVMADRSLVAETCIDSIIPANSKILSINSLSADSMITAMLPYMSGEREFYRVSRLDKQFAALFEMLYGGKAEYLIEYTEPGSDKVKKVSVPASTHKEMISRSPKAAPKFEIQPYQFRIDTKKGIAIMEFNKCINPSKMTAFCDSMFKELTSHNIRKLIIDVRQNGGGDSRVGDVLLRRLAKKPFYQTAGILAKVSPAAIERFGEGDPGMLFYEVPESAYIQPLPNDKGHFDGETILLTSNHTFSSASSFANAFKEADCGMIVGEETGGMTVSFGDMMYWTMPVSGIVTTISYKRFWFMNSDEHDIHGVIPHIPTKAENALETAIKHFRKK